MDHNFKIGDVVIAIDKEIDSDYDLGYLGIIQKIQGSFIFFKKHDAMYAKNFILYKTVKFDEDIKELLK